MPWSKIPIDTTQRLKAQKLKARGKRAITYREALRETLYQALEIDPRVFVMGEGVDDPGGIFGTTKGLQRRFGEKRVFDIPIAENAMTGVAIGAALAGMRPIFIHMRMDFLLPAMDQIVNHASKWRFMFGGRVNVPIVIRTLIGRGWGSAAQHSQSIQGLFIHTPGLKVVMPATAYDAKGLLFSSIADNDPVIFIEHRWLYETVDYVPEDRYLIPFGKAILRKKGKDVTVVATSLMVHEALKAAKVLKKEGIEVEIIDVRSLVPLDEELILGSVKKTKRLVIADTGWKTGGMGAEISARVVEAAFKFLKAPILRIATKDTPTPASSALEEEFYPSKDDIIKTVKEIL
jgi:pyruvate dehydrogenase E1 component beta subunit